MRILLLSTLLAATIGTAHAGPTLTSNDVRVGWFASDTYNHLQGFTHDTVDDNLSQVRSSFLNEVAYAHYANTLDASGDHQKIKDGRLRTKVYQGVVTTEKVDNANWKVSFPAKTIFIGKHYFERCAKVTMSIFQFGNDLKIESIKSKKANCAKR